jgi:hypothetical protein
MKTTLELPDALFREAKATAARRGTSLKALFTEALRRELDGNRMPPVRRVYQVDEDGMPYLPPRGAKVTADLIERIRAEEGI